MQFKQFGIYYLVIMTVHSSLNLQMKFTTSLTSLSNEAANSVNVNISLLASPKKNLSSVAWLLNPSIKKGGWKTCLLQVVRDCSNDFLHLAKLNFDYCPAYSLCTASTGFLYFQAFNFGFADARGQLILPCVCNTLLQKLQVMDLSADSHRHLRSMLSSFSPVCYCHLSTAKHSVRVQLNSGAKLLS